MPRALPARRWRARSSALPPRLAAVGKRAGAFPRVPRIEHRPVGGQGAGAQDGVSRTDAGCLRFPQDLQHGGDRQRRGRADGPGQLAGGGHQFGGGYHPVDQPPPGGLGGGEPPAGEQKLHRDGPRQAGGQPQQAARVRHQAQCHLGEGELGVLGGDHQVRGQDKLEPAAERQPVDGRDDRLADVEELGDPGESAGAMVRLYAFPGGGCFQVPPGAEEPVAGRGEDADPQSRVVAQPVEGRIQRIAGGDVDGVGFRPVKGDDKRLPLDGDLHGLTRVHGSHSPYGRSRDLAMMWRWISLVPSQIRSTLASRHQRSTGSSLIRPMPPKICTAVSVILPSISDAYSFAIAASASVIVPWSSFAAARRVSISAASNSVAMSASWNPTPWNRPIGWPNCRRLAAHWVAASSTRRARPTLVAATCSRVAPSHLLISSRPRPSSPSRLAAGTRQPLNTSSHWW